MNVSDVEEQRKIDNEKIFLNIMSAASFAGVLFMISMLVYVNITKAGREERNRQYIQSIVDKGSA